MTPTKWPRQPERAARLRTSQRKHKEKVKHRIIDLESRLFTTECKLERALAAIATLSDDLCAVLQQNTLRPGHRPLSTAKVNSEAAHGVVQKCTLPWENDAKPEDFSWSSALLQGGKTAQSSLQASEGGTPDRSSSNDTCDSSTSRQSDTPASTSFSEDLAHESYDALDLTAMRDWIEPRFKKPFGKDADRIQPSSLFALMDFISS